MYQHTQNHGGIQQLGKQGQEQRQKPGLYCKRPTAITFVPPPPPPSFKLQQQKSGTSIPQPLPLNQGPKAQLQNPVTEPPCTQEQQKKPSQPSSQQICIPPKALQPDVQPFCYPPQYQKQSASPLTSTFNQGIPQIVMPPMTVNQNQQQQSASPLVSAFNQGIPPMTVNQNQQNASPPIPTANQGIPQISIPPMAMNQQLLQSMQLPGQILSMHNQNVPYLSMVPALMGGQQLKSTAQPQIVLPKSSFASTSNLIGHKSKIVLPGSIDSQQNSNACLAIPPAPQQPLLTTAYNTQIQNPFSMGPNNTAGSFCLSGPSAPPSQPQHQLQISIPPSTFAPPSLPPNSSAPSQGRDIEFNYQTYLHSPTVFHFQLIHLLLFFVV